MHASQSIRLLSGRAQRRAQHSRRSRGSSCAHSAAMPEQQGHCQAQGVLAREWGWAEPWRGAGRGRGKGSRDLQGGWAHLAPGRAWGEDGPNVSRPQAPHSSRTSDCPEPLGSAIQNLLKVRTCGRSTRRLVCGTDVHWSHPAPSAHRQQRRGGLPRADLTSL